MTPAEQISYLETNFPELAIRRNTKQTSFWIPSLGQKGRVLRINDESELKLAATARLHPEKIHTFPRFEGPAEALRAHMLGELTLLGVSHTSVGTGTASSTNWELAVQALQALGGRATRAAILQQVRMDVPDFSAENLRKDLTMLSVNDRARFQYRAWATRRRVPRADRDRVFRDEGSGGQTVYELYDPARHGIWVAHTNEFGALELRREEASIAQLVDHISNASLTPFDPSAPTDGKLYVAATIAARQGQQTFRKKLLRAYGNQCCLSGCTIKEIVEAAHIRSFDGPSTHDLTNGLPLRADLHTLFDLGLIRLQTSNDLTWEVHPSLRRDPEYAKYHGRKLNAPTIQPSVKAIELHRETYAGKWAPNTRPHPKGNASRR